MAFRMARLNLNRQNKQKYPALIIELQSLDTYTIQ